MDLQEAGQPQRDAVTDTRVVVIEPDGSKTASWEAALRFLDYDPIIVPDVGSLDWPCTAQLDWVAVMLGEANCRGTLRELLARLKDYPASVPVVCSGSGGREAGPTQLSLDLPLKYAQLASVLQEARALRAPAGQRACAFRPGGTSAAIATATRLAEQVAAFDTNVLILGESGTGKEMLARHVHELSGRAARPFVPVNCGAIPPDLLESELFGHEKGAFTGALTARIGRFELAEGGTLFLDEIGDMPAAMQVKLLRVLQERVFERVGSNKSQRCDVRVIAATHRDLDAAIANGSFREDLFYRLNVFPIRMPALRERIADLPALVAQLAERLDQHLGRRVSLTDAGLRALSGYGWPGNVRELANLLERLAILHPGERIGVEHLPERYRDASTLPALQPPRDAEAAAGLPSDGLDLKDHLAQLEVCMIREAMERAGGTVAEAARLLRMQRTTLVEKIRKYRLEIRPA